MELLPYAPERDVYRLLQVDPRAGTDEIVAACRRLAAIFHPDRNPSGRAHHEMQVVNAVRRLLTDPMRRAEYDRERWIWHLAERFPRRPAPPRTDGVAYHPVAAPVPMSTATRYARATLIGLRAGFIELVPARCHACRAAVGRRDDFCAVCGAAQLAPAVR
jgi:curved DNA-binding protein CbpA